MTEKPWLRDLPFGLPVDFDYSIVRTAKDACNLMFALPNRDRPSRVRPTMLAHVLRHVLVPMHDPQVLLLVVHSEPPPHLRH